MESQKPALKAERPSREHEQWGAYHGIVDPNHRMRHVFREVTTKPALMPHHGASCAIVFTGLGLVTLGLWVWLSAYPGVGYVAVAALVAEAFVVARLDDWRMLRAGRRA